MSAAGAVVQRLDRGVAGIALEQAEDRLALGRDAQATGPEQIGELGNALHDLGTLSTIIVGWEPYTLGPAAGFGGEAGWCHDAAVLLIGEIFANAARTAPNVVAATLDDRRADVRRDRRRGQPRRARPGRGRHRAGDRVLWWGDTSLEAVPLFAALAKLGAVFAPLNARASVGEVRTGGRVRAAALLLAGTSHSDVAMELAELTGIPHLERVERGAAAPPTVSGLDERDPTSSSSRAGAPGRPKGVVLSHRTNWLRTYPGRHDHAGRRRHRVHVPAVPHGGLDEHRAPVRGIAAGRCTSYGSPTRRPSATTAPPIACCVALLHHRGVGPGGARAPHRARRPCRSRPSLGHRHVRDAARTVARAQSRAAVDTDAGL